ncbi:MAG: PAS domain S-box protein [Deltaproteobacteria bacterium]|nr:PAS domain S-box protein [Deltaproteobacteria bacterium]
MLAARDAELAACRQALDSAPFGALVYELSPEGDLHLRAANRAADAILGVDCSTLIGRTLEQAFPALAGTEIPAAFRRVAAHGERYSNEHVAYDERGIRGVFEVAAVQIGDHRVAVFFRDVTEKAGMIDALRASEDALRTVVDSAYDGIVIHDAAGRILDVNAKALEMYGVTREQGRALSIVGDFSSESNPRELLGDLWLRVLAGEPQRFEWRARRPNTGAEFDVEVGLRKIRYYGADVVLANIRDLTDRKSLERQFAHAQKMEAMGRLASGAAHDFRNTLLLISSYAQLMMDDVPQDSPLRADLDEILAATTRADALTNQLLAFSRNEPNVPRVVVINDEIARMAPVLERVLGREVELCLHLAEDAGRARLDPSQLEQAIVNLAVNAHDAMPQGGRLTIRTAKARRTGTTPMQSWAPVLEQIVLEISDTGTGIPQELLPRIFEPFFTTKPAGTGTGLGLPMVYGAVTQNGGDIEVESEVGVGTTFRMWFPRLDDDTR